eukprot:scaffold428011_cov22-Prasinocladus_malaysianus.AAC.1
MQRSQYEYGYDHSYRYGVSHLLAVLNPTEIRVVATSTRTLLQKYNCDRTGTCRSRVWIDTGTVIVAKLLSNFIRVREIILPHEFSYDTQSRRYSRIDGLRERSDILSILSNQHPGQAEVNGRAT